MSDPPPNPPSELPDDVVDAIADCSPEELNALAQYAETLAAHQAKSESEEVEEDDDDVDEEDTTDQPDADSENRPDSVPAKASTTIKKINRNRYYYWQWRDGDQVRSQYKGPVESDGGN